MTIDVKLTNEEITALLAAARVAISTGHELSAAVTTAAEKLELRQTLRQRCDSIRATNPFYKGQGKKK
jgi:hypothetical protein